MPTQLSYGLFPLLNEAAINENTRPGTIMLEYFQVDITIATNEGTAEVPTVLEEVLGVLDLGYVSTAGSDPTDTVKLVTDGTITTNAVTVAAKSVDIANGDITVRGFLVGRTRSQTALINSPDD